MIVQNSPQDLTDLTQQNQTILNDLSEIKNAVLNSDGSSEALDNISLKIDNLSKKLDYEAQTIQTLVGYEYIADDNAVAHTLNNAEFIRPYGTTDLTPIPETIIMEYSGTIKIGISTQINGGNQLHINKNGTEVAVLSLGFSEDFKSHISSSITVNSGDVISFTIGTNQYVTVTVQANSIKILAVKEPIYEYETITECSKVSAVKSIQRGIITIATSGLSATATISTVALDRSVVLFSGYGVNSGTEGQYWRAHTRLELTSPTTVTATRDGGGGGTLKIPYQVIEFY